MDPHQSLTTASPPGHRRLTITQDIRDFLDRTIKEIEPPQVKELVKQYKTILDEWAQEEANEESEDVLATLLLVDGDWSGDGEPKV